MHAALAALASTTRSEAPARQSHQAAELPDGVAHRALRKQVRQKDTAKQQSHSDRPHFSLGSEVLSETARGEAQLRDCSCGTAAHTIPSNAQALVQRDASSS